MSAVADAIEKLIYHVLNNIDTISVKRIRTKARGNLAIDNGAGASILLKGDQVLINGLSSGAGGNVFEIIYIGADKKCWITRDRRSGDLVFHVNTGTGISFERGGGYIFNGTIASTNASYVNKNSPTEIMYPIGFMQVTSTDVRQEAFIQFELSGAVTLPVSSAKVRLYNTRTGNSGTTWLIFSRTLSKFDQTTLTWNNQPAYLTRDADSDRSIENTGTEGWFEFDVTNLMNESNGIYFGLNIRHDDGAELTFYSASGIHPPELVVA